MEREARQEQKPTEEIISASSRIVIFGSNTDFRHLLPSFEETLKKAGIKNADVKLVRDVAYLPEGFYNDKSTEERISTKTLPKGVVLLPTMRQYFEGTGGNVSTYGCGVQTEVRRMCQENNVPLVEVHYGNTEKRITKKLRRVI